MILTCPECATSYFVDDARIPPQGRTVKCATCGARWKASREVEDAAVEPEAALPPPPEPAATAIPVDGVEFVPAEAPALRPRAAAARTPAPAKPDRSAALLWAGMAATAAVLIGGAIVFRQEVVRLWPTSSAAYQGLGLKVDGAGLVIEQVKAVPDFLGGRPVLAVSGAIRNVRDQTAQAPPIRISLLNRGGKPIAAKIARPLDGAIPAHGTRHFAVAILDPPASVHDLEVTFEPAQTLTAQAHPQASAHAAEAVSTAAPEEAKPLPPEAPEVLPEHG